MSAALICILMTLIAYIIRADLPPADGTEIVRQMHLWAGFVGMGVIDALTIALIRWDGHAVKRLTNPLTIVLSCSIINHAFGAFAYASVNFTALDVYDEGVIVVGLAQVAVFMWWMWGRRYGRRDRRFHPRTPCLNLHGRTIAPRGEASKAVHR